MSKFNARVVRRSLLPQPRRCGSSVARTLVVAGASILAGLGIAAGAKGAALQTVVGGLDNPRGLALLPDGRLGVAEAGHAGAFCLAAQQCAGLTGKVVAVDVKNGRQTTLASGFPSLGGAFAPFGLGGLAMQRGTLYAIVGVNPQTFGSPATDCHGNPNLSACIATLTAVVHSAGTLDRLKSLTANRGWRIVAQVGRFDFNYAAAHPDPGNSDYAPGDADPFGLIAGPTGGFYVVDGASNTLGRVTAGGQVSVLAFIPDPPGHKPIYDAAPTCAVKTSNGSIIVATESGSVWRYKSRHLTRLLLGGKVGQVVSCVADSHGNVYLGNMDARIIGFIGQPSTGSIVKMAPDLRTTYVVKGLNYPTGMGWGPDGKLYVTDNALCPSDLSAINAQNAPPQACPGSGRVVRVGAVSG
jgi:hypothetical protein